MTANDNCRFCFVEIKKIFYETTGLNDLLHSTNDVCKVLYKYSSFNFVPVSICYFEPHGIFGILTQG